MVENANIVINISFIIKKSLWKNEKRGKKETKNKKVCF